MTPQPSTTGPNGGAAGRGYGGRFGPATVPPGATPTPALRPPAGRAAPARDAGGPVTLRSVGTLSPLMAVLFRITGHRPRLPKGPPPMKASSGTTAKATTTADATDVIPAASTSCARHARVVSAVAGFFSLDGGTTWDRIAANTPTT